MDYDALPSCRETAVTSTSSSSPARSRRYPATRTLLQRAGPARTRGRGGRRYRRTTPEGPWIYKGGSVLGLRLHGRDGASGLRHRRVHDRHAGLQRGLRARALARSSRLQGAEIIFMPAGLWKMAQWDTWRVLTRARAIENLAYTATCQNILGHETSNAGLAMICSPEAVLAEGSVEGVLVADCDLDRIRYLRAEEDRRGLGEGLQGRRALAVVPARAVQSTARSACRRREPRLITPELAGPDRQAVAARGPRGRAHRASGCGRTPWASTTPSSTTRRSPRARGSNGSPPRPDSSASRGGCRGDPDPGPPIRGLHPELTGA